jgi:polyhydroxyalkanoate synthesis regulator phasin
MADGPETPKTAAASPAPASPAPAGKPALPTPEAPKQAPEPAKQPAEASNAPAPEGEKNVFTELFGNDAAKRSGLMENVSELESKKGEKILDVKAQKKAIKGPRDLKKMGSIALQVTTLFWVISFGFFFSQNALSFKVLGVNPANRAQIAEDQVAQVQADIHVQRHLSAALLLDQFHTLADEYFFNLEQAESPFSSQNKKEEYKDAAAEALPELTSLVEATQEKLEDAPGPEEILEARSVIDELITELRSKTGEVDEQTLLQDIQDLESAKTLMQSKAYKSNVLAVDAGAMTETDVQSIYDGFSDINQSVNSLISQIQSGRTDWAFYLEEVEKLVKTVDPLFNTEFESNVTVSSLNFRDSLQVDISGNTQTDDSRNFTLISNLIDVMEDSPHFMDVEERSYSKSEQDEDYKGSFRISMTIELPENEQ